MGLCAFALPPDSASATATQVCSGFPSQPPSPAFLPAPAMEASGTGVAATELVPGAGAVPAPGDAVGFALAGPAVSIIPAVAPMTPAVAATAPRLYWDCFLCLPLVIIRYLTSVSSIGS